MSTMEPAAPNGGVAEDRAHQKSFKRKYRKLRHKFKEVMKRSDELFKQDQLAKQAIRRMQEENNRILDLLVDLNTSSHIPKDRRHNIGSPSRATPPRFLSPTLLATIYGNDPSLLNRDGDVEAMELEEQQAAARQTEEEAKPDSDRETSDDDDDDDEEEDKTPAAGLGSKYNSDDEEDDKEAYLEEIREWNYKRGIAGTPPRSVREKMKADAEQERKDAEEQAKKAAAEAAADKINGVRALVEPVVKQENEEESTNGLGEAPPKPLLVEEYRRGHTPEYLRQMSPFLMTLAEEDEWYREIDEKYDGDIPPLQHPDSPSAAKAEGDPRNPMSVYCWLRKNQPQVFLQEEEGKKPGRGRGGRRKVVEPESGDEGAGSLAGKTVDSARGAGAKRRRTNGTEAGDTPASSRGGRGRGGGKGGRRKTEGEPSTKRPRR